MKTHFAALFVAVTVVTTVTLGASDPVRERALQQAIDLIETKGDAVKAMPLLEETARSTDRALAVRALLYLGQLQERRDKTEARSTYQRIIAGFADQTEAATVARTRLSAIGVSAAPDALNDRVVASGLGKPGSDLSLDGRYLVEPDDVTAGPVVHDLVTGSVTRIVTRGPKDVGIHRPALSRDGRQIAYWAISRGVGSDVHEIRIVANRQGSQPQTIWSSVSSPDIAHLTPCFWSTDGKALFVDVNHQDDTWQFGWLSIESGRLDVIASFGWRRPDVPRDMPDLSPDGRYVVYSALATNPSKPEGPPARERDERIYIMAADGSTQTELTRTAGSNRQPRWSPDGSHVLFLSGRAGTLDLWAVPIRAGRTSDTPFLVKKNVIEGYSKRLSASGSYFYVVDNSGPQIAITRMGDASPTASLSEPLFGARPKWSPDGGKIAVFRGKDVVVSSIATGEERRFTSAKDEDEFEEFAWLHDGSALMALVAHGDSDLAETPRSLVRLTPRSGAWEELATNISGWGALSLDDQTLYVTWGQGQQGRITAVDLKSGRRRTVFESGAKFLGGLSISPDGRTFAFTTGGDTQDTLRLGRLNLDGTQYRDLGAVGPLGGVETHWSTDSRTIFFRRTRMDGMTRVSDLMQIAASGGTATPTGVTLGIGGGGWDVDPSRQRVAFMVVNEGSELRAIEGVGAFLKAAR